MSVNIEDLKLPDYQKENLNILTGVHGSQLRHIKLYDCGCFRYRLDQRVKNSLMSTCKKCSTQLKVLQSQLKDIQKQINNINEKVDKKPFSVVEPVVTKHYKFVIKD